MADNGFGSDLWKNVQAIKLTTDGGLEAPVRADGKHGIVVGVDAIATSEAADAGQAVAPAAPRRWWTRLRLR